MRDQRQWQVPALEVLGDQRVVGRLHAVLHGQVQRGRRLAAAAHAHEDHVGALQVARRLPVIVRQREVDRLDAIVILLALGGIGKAPDAVVGLDAELGFQRLDEGAEHVQHQAVAQAAGDDVAHLVVDQRDEDDRPLAFAQRRFVDLPHHRPGLVDRVDEGPAHMARLGRELREDRVAEGFGGDAGAVGDEEHGAMGHGARQGRERTTAS